MREVSLDAEDLINRGCIIAQIKFLPNFDILKEKLATYEWHATFQPKSTFYGDRMQAYPCWETHQLEEIDPENYNIIFLEFQKLFRKKITYFNCFIRKIITEELKQSPQFKDCRYGFVHDDSRKFGAIIPFEHSLTGGTAFFEHHWEKIPDIEYGAYPNRLTLFWGLRNHAASHDYSYKQRHVLCAFMDTED